jgi:hypothetical protein
LNFSLDIHFVFSTSIATEFHVFPLFFPFFTPQKWSLANKTNFGGEMLFFRAFHQRKDKLKAEMF